MSNAAFLTSDEKRVLQSLFIDWNHNASPDLLLEILITNNLTGVPQQQKIRSQPTDYDKNRYIFTEIILRLPYSLLNTLRSCLLETGDGSLVELAQRFPRREVVEPVNPALGVLSSCKITADCQPIPSRARPLFPSLDADPVALTTGQNRSGQWYHSEPHGPSGTQHPHPRYNSEPQQAHPWYKPELQHTQPRYNSEPQTITVKLVLSNASDQREPHNEFKWTEGDWPLPTGHTDTVGPERSFSELAVGVERSSSELSEKAPSMNLATDPYSQPGPGLRSLDSLLSSLPSQGHCTDDPQLYPGHQGDPTGEETRVPRYIPAHSGDHTHDEERTLRNIKESTPSLPRDGQPLVTQLPRDGQPVLPSYRQSGQGLCLVIILKDSHFVREPLDHSGYENLTQFFKRDLDFEVSEYINVSSSEAVRQLAAVSLRLKQFPKPYGRIVIIIFGECDREGLVSGDADDTGLDRLSVSDHILPLFTNAAVNGLTDCPRWILVFSHVNNVYQMNSQISASQQREIDNTSLQSVMDNTSLQRVMNNTSLQSVMDNTSPQRVMNNTSLQRVDNTSLQTVMDNTSLQRMIDNTSLQRVMDITSLQRVVHRDMAVLHVHSMAGKPSVAISQCVRVLQDYGPYEHVVDIMVSLEAQLEQLEDTHVSFHSKLSKKFYLTSRK